MRKNKMMRAASALLVAVLLTTSTISGTFAKYVTTNTATDTARVAKWGVELQVAGNLFGEAYEDDIIADENDTLKFEVLAEPKTEDVVAPGTENTDGFTFSVNGKPEVSGQIVINKLEVQNIYLNVGTYGTMVPVAPGVVNEANFDEFADELYTEATGTYTKATAWADVAYYTLEDVVTLDAIYYPVVFTLANKFTTGTYSADSLIGAADALAEKFDFDTTPGLQNVTKTLLNGVTSYTFGVKDTIKFAPNTLLSDLDLEAEKLTWIWKFENSVALNGADTILGNLMAEKRVVKLDDNDTPTDDTDDKYKAPEAATGAELRDYCLYVKFDLQMTVEQTDENLTA